MAPLPAPLTSLVGRERELAAVVALVQRDGARLLTVTGPGGVGKTRLALQAASDLVPAFSDGVVFIDLAPVRDAEFVAPTMAQALGLRHDSHLSAADVLKAFLRDQVALLLLDNFEQVVEAGPLVADLLRMCPRLTVLVTSRTILNVLGERVTAVPPLALPDLDRLLPVAELAKVEAVRLFIERARAVKADFVLSEVNAEAVAAICAELDGLPLAIELAAARSALFAPAALLTRLERGLSQLAGGPRDQPARLRTMRDAVAWSYDLLTAEEQTLFRCLAVFADGCTLEAAEAVAGSGNVDVVAGVESLVQQSLVRVVEPVGDGAEAHAGRLVMLETIREYARERLAETSEIADARRRHAVHFLALAEAGKARLRSPGEADWLARIGVDRENLRHAVAWADEEDEVEIGLRLAAALYIAWHRGGLVSEARTWFDRLLAPARCAGVPDAVRAEAAIAASWISSTQADFAATLVYATDAVELAQTAKSAESMARALMFLGVAHLGGNLEQAKAYLGEAVALHRQLDDYAGLPVALGNLGVAMRRCGDLDAAAALFAEQLELEDARGYAPGVIRARLDLGDLALDRGEADEALVHFRESLAGSRSESDLVFATMCVTSIGLAEATESPVYSARLLGAGETLRTLTGLTVWSFDSDRYDRTVAGLRARLGNEAFSTAWAAGRALAVEDAIAEALASPTESPARQRSPLTSREAQILLLLVAGKTDREIAAALFLSRRTVEGHVGRLLAKLGVATRTGAVSAAIATGLIDPGTVPRHERPAQPAENA